MIMKFLVATDGSEEADGALAYATDISDAMGGSITVVYAVDPTVYEEREGDPISGISDADRRLIIENIEDAEDRGLDILDEAAAFAEDLDHEVETELLYGDPVSEITDYAEEKGFETIFVGHRGRSEHTDRLLGSVAKEIVERATIPVTVVR
jgi:nucleotide-binding universal stress UspA family protein